VENGYQQVGKRFYRVAVLPLSEPDWVSEWSDHLITAIVLGLAFRKRQGPPWKVVVFSRARFALLDRVESVQEVEERGEAGRIAKAIVARLRAGDVDGLPA
jgi:hypothetical protein